ncbi:Sjogren's syndrome/scleroderma autoantigen 1 family protein [Natronobacterium gregoryi]|uniref:Zn-finger containing protein n=2 Tax=Natronobacterium gregoryi TaxID=44930 RepID=L0AI97_NATGS|nr:Sjogren's syndrome/scleroderma autoantigen 1 family protein [Natronobacterium gregoryi]AFZ72902.1 putative Zn-finger containing protein [Natronobacterium gregoryi SP2]ELY69801.1 hypothetical protein C490_07366 [Natronobacterium gregoryi SP2]PLK21869.1 hypothetical protein CYV19_01870 [Natronobacterium gregoryi SP2]SFI66827.1 Uncharacterized Zn-finger containing protein, UPF0148 family [Natronobacterium gregoryi]
MSDFDKEAEREKLREKYERDEAERKATQRMSDLLLKGATMTNAHCGTCGDPLFKDDGVTFCPSCHGNPDAVQGTDLEAQPAQEESEDGAAERERHETERVDEHQSRPDDRSQDSAHDRDRSRRTDENETRATSDLPTTRDEVSPAVRTPPAQTGRRDHPQSRETTDRGDDFESARASLQETLERFAAEAAAADDPRYATECLEAAHEAAETLQVLR